MAFYLGVHSKFDAKLLNVFTFNNSAVAIRYEKHVQGVHPENKQPIECVRTIMEVLELENNKIAIIRKYHE